jgi:phosphoglycolate phosphatase
MFAVWAAYDAEHSAAMYEALVRISHWTPQEVARERQLRIEAKAITPDFVAHREFAEVLSVFGIFA